VEDVAPYERERGGRTERDAARFSVDSGDKEYKLRALSAAEGERWIEGLTAWREYFLMNMY
jgi:hypothetical protein